MREKSLEFNLTIKTIPESGEPVEISGLDIDFDIIKTNTSENNKANFTVWNMDETTYQRLTEKDEAVYLFAAYGEDEPSLVFKGDIQKILKKNDGIQKSADIPAYIELSDGQNTYRTAKINKNYREKVTSTAIIKDCINAMGLAAGNFSQNFPEKIYYGYKASGYAHVILQQICRPLGCKFSIQNGLVHIISNLQEAQEETALELSMENSARPRRSGTDEFIISTGFVPYINPNSSVKCDFNEFSGLRLIKCVHSYGNNYGKPAVTEITI